MAIVDFTFPQGGDNDYSENFGTWLARSNITDYVEEGMDVTITDPSAPEAEITAGRAFVSGTDINFTETAAGDDRMTVDIVVIKPQETITSTDGLTDSDVNHIYLNPNFGTNDSAVYNVYTDESNAAVEAIKIAEVDLVNDTVTLTNQNPDTEFGNANFTVNLGIPIYSDTSNAQTGEGNLIYIDGAGSQDEGLYLHNGSSYTKTGVDSLAELSDVSGVTNLQEASNANRPAAGQEGRIFFDTTSHEVQYDSGSSWITLGIDPGEIGAGELGFNPATQNELDTHASDTDAHHTRPNAGSYITEDPNNDFDVRLGAGVEGDGSNNIRVDEGYDFTFTADVDFDSGFDVSGDITDDGSSEVIYDSANGWVPESVLENTTIGVSAGDGLSGGGSPSLGGSTTLSVNVSDFAGSHLSASNNNLNVNDDFVLNSGDTITGQINMEAVLNADASGGRVVLPVGTDMYAT